MIEEMAIPPPMIDAAKTYGVEFLVIDFDWEYKLNCIESSRKHMINARLILFPHKSHVIHQDRSCRSKNKNKTNNCEYH